MQAQGTRGSDLGGACHRGRGGPGGWIVLYEPELHPGPDVIVPDVAAWRRERLPAVPKAAFIDLAPNWACEVLSPSTALVDRRLKLPMYAREKVAHVWLVDPDARSVEVFRLDGESYRLVTTRGEAEVVRLDPFEAIELELGALWPQTSGSAG